MTTILFDANTTIKTVLANPFSAAQIPDEVKQFPDKTVGELWTDPDELSGILWQLNDGIVRFAEGDQDSLLLWDNPPLYNSEFSGRPYLDRYLLDHPAPVAVVVPGGGYQSLAMGHEGVDMARAFNDAGFHAVVLRYRVAPNRYPAPQMDLIRAIKLVRANAESWQINPDQLVVCGFSAGGHLTGSVGGLYDHNIQLPDDEFAAISAKPNALILSYAVLSFTVNAHQGSVTNLLGDNNTPEMREFLSCERMVTSSYPPSFIWTTEIDGSVPITNSKKMAEACQQAGVPHELHIYPEGRHGLGLAKGLPAEPWFDAAIAFVNGVFRRE